MANVSTCSILNEIDKTYFTLYVEWTNASFKIMLLKPTMVPLIGEMSSKDVNYFANEHSKSCNQYLQETRDTFSGKDSGTQFFYENETFKWKKGKAWTIGKISVHLVSDVTVVSEILYYLLDHYRCSQERLFQIEKENELLQNNNGKLIADIKEMINIKTNMEKELYKKFLLILNTKKKKIRELTDSLNNKKDTGKSVFDIMTDESDDDDVDEDFNEAGKDSPHTSKNCMPEERMVIEKATYESNESDKKTNNNFNIDFKRMLERKNMKSGNSSDESEYELELKLSDYPAMEEPSTSRLNFAENSDEELFSE